MNKKMEIYTLCEFKTNSDLLNKSPFRETVIKDKNKLLEFLAYRKRMGQGKYPDYCSFVKTDTIPEEELYDCSVSNERVTGITSSAKIPTEDISYKFSESQSRDFYLGMMAFERVMMKLISNVHYDKLRDEVENVGICAAFIANSKK